MLDKSKVLRKEAHVILLILVVLASLSLLNFGFASSISNSTRMFVWITNTAPVVVFANVTPNPALPSQTLTYKINVTDANSDTMTVSIIYYNTTHKARSSSIKVPVNGNWRINNTFTLPSDADPGTWYVNATISDGLATVINKTIFTVSSLVGTRLQNSPIDFGNQTAGQTAQRASNGTAVAGKYKAITAGWPLIINNTGNTKNNYTINGTDLVGTSKTIGVSNVTWALTRTGEGSRTSKTALTKSQVSITTGKTAGQSQRVYFWTDTPNGIKQQQYNGTIIIVTNTQ